MERRGSSWVRAAFAALALAPAAGAGAAYGGGAYGGSGFTADTWPAELVRRPLTLAAGMLELQAPLALDLSASAPGGPAAIPLSVHAGLADWLTLGLGYTRGFCRSAPAGACASSYDALRLDALAAFYAAGPLSAAYGVSLASTTAAGQTALSAEALVEARLSAGRFALVAAPSYGFGLDRRTDGSRIAAPGFPLATSLAFGAGSAVPNRETVHLPLAAEVQVAARLALAAGAALDGVVDPVTGSFADTRRVPVGFAVVATPVRTLDVGAGLTFTDVAGRGGLRSGDRVAEVFLAVRPGGGGAETRSAAAIAPHAAATGAVLVPAVAQDDPLTIVIDGFAFAPRTLEVPRGATVTVRNADGVPHSVTSERAPDAFEPGAVGGVSFDTGAFTGERTFTIPADAPPGIVVPFYCSVHRGSMRTPNGEIRVVGDGGAPRSARTASAP